MRPPPVLRHPAILAAAIVLFGALVLLPGVGRPGLWEPQEMAVADQAAARADGTYQPGPSLTACQDTADPSGARTLTPRAAAWGLRHVSSSDAGLRVPMVLIGLLGLLAVFGVGVRLGSTRAGVIAAVVMMSFPLWSLQARQLTGELPGAVGATLIVYALCVLAAPRRDKPGYLALDLIVAAAALYLGVRLAFLGSGALVGLLPPLLAIALAGAFAVPELARLAGRGWRAIDRRRDADPDPDPGFDWWRFAALLIASLGTLVVAIWIARQVFDLVPRTPGTRAIGDHSIVTSDCWSSAVGGWWRKDDDLRITYDSIFEQAGFGMFPWSILAVIALGSLASGLVDPRRRFAGALLFAWAAAAWVCAAVFARKVGLVVFPGFPACAIGIGLFIDELYERRRAAAIDPAPYRDAAWNLCGLAVLLSVVVLAKDLQAFPERMTSLLVGGGEQIKYPAQARLFGIGTREWILGLGILAALPFALDLWLWRAPRRAGEPESLLESTGLPRFAPWGARIAFAMTLALALFWTHGWHRSVSRSLSSKHIFSVYRDLRRPGDTLGIMGQMGNAPRYYAGGKWDTLTTRDELITYLRRPTRTFAMAPAGELCAIHKAKADGLDYFVIDDSNSQTLLLSNQRGTQQDRNPIATSILRQRPADVGTPVSVVYDDAIEIIGVKLPAAVGRGDKFEITMYYRVIKPIGGAWKVFAHFDGGQRFNGDHDPIRGRCATNYWQPGDYIVDRFTASAGDVGFAKGGYDMWVGFFTGSNPNWRNMPVTQGAKDNNNRVKVGTIRLR